MSNVKVQGFDNLVRDTNTNAIISTNVSDYRLYMQRIKMRENQQDEIRSAVKEINNIKKDIREIKELIREIVK